MIIRTSVAHEYVSLPNAIFQDRRLSLDTKGLLGYLLSLPPDWEVRPRIVSKVLSPEKGKGRALGMDRLRRMFNEIIETGYMARSTEQTKRADGFFGSYIYIVGGDPQAVKREADALGVAFLPPRCLPCTGSPRTANPTPDKVIKGNNKSQIQIETDELQFGTAAIEAERNKGLSGNGTRRPRSTKMERTEVIQARIADRLGSRGWSILMELPSHELDQLTAQERVGRLTDQHLAELHVRYPARDIRREGAA